MAKKKATSFESWYNDIEEISDKGILQVKNGLEYKISLTTAKKPILKKQKSEQFDKLRKKFEVTGVNLLALHIVNQKEIDKIILEDPSQELRYKNIIDMQLETTYTLKLTEQQYKSLTIFMSKNKIDLDEAFYFRRFGKTINTFFKFALTSQIKIVKQQKLKK